MGIKIVRTEGGKTNWPFFRHVFYTGLIVWAVVVRMMGVDPFDDLLAMRVDLGTLFDLLVLWAFWMIVWYIAYPMRPRFNSTN